MLKITPAVLALATAVNVAGAGTISNVVKLTVAVAV
jgi:hypothetical protein